MLGLDGQKFHFVCDILRGRNWPELVAPEGYVLELTAEQESLAKEQRHGYKTPEDRVRLMYDEYVGGRTMKELSADHGISPGTICTLFKELGLTARSRGGASHRSKINGG